MKEIHWGVQVTCNGVGVLSMGSHGGISGRRAFFTPDEVEAIRRAGNHLLFFIGEDDAEQAEFLPEEEE